MSVMAGGVRVALQLNRLHCAGPAGGDEGGGYGTKSPFLFTPYLLFSTGLD